MNDGNNKELFTSATKKDEENIKDILRHTVRVVVTGGSTPAAVAGDWLVSTYDQNALGSNDSLRRRLNTKPYAFNCKR